MDVGWGLRMKSLKVDMSSHYYIEVRRIYNDWAILPLLQDTLFRSVRLRNNSEALWVMGLITINPLLGGTLRSRINLADIIEMPKNRKMRLEEEKNGHKIL